MNKVIGTIKAIFDEQVVSDKFRKREFVLTTNDKYPQDVLFQLTQGNTDLIDTIRVGEQVEVSYNLNGKEYTNKEGKTMYFNSLNVWQVAIQQGSTPAPQQVQQGTPQVQENDSDLPF
jgi:hypothetical protein